MNVCVYVDAFKCMYRYVSVFLCGIVLNELTKVMLSKEVVVSGATKKPKQTLKCTNMFLRANINGCCTLKAVVLLLQPQNCIKYLFLFLNIFIIDKNIEKKVWSIIFFEHFHFVFCFVLAYFTLENKTMKCVHTL